MPRKVPDITISKGYPNFGVYDIGKTVSFRINAYIDTKEEQELTKIFPLLVEMGVRTLGNTYRGASLFVLEDAVQHIAEDMLMLIAKEPMRFVCKNFYYYYRRAVLGRTAQMLKDFYKSYEQLVSIDECDDEDEEGDFNYFEYPFKVEFSPIGALIKKDEYKFLVKRIYSKLGSSPRFFKRPDYLLWPMIVSIIYEEHEFFDSLSFRDRAALRALRCVISDKNYLYA